MERAESSSSRLLPPPLAVPAAATRVKPQARRFTSYSTSTASGGDASALCSPVEQLDASRCWPPGALRAHFQRDACAVLIGTYSPECLMLMTELFTAGRITLFNSDKKFMNDNSQCWPIIGVDGGICIHFTVVTSTFYAKMMDSCTQKLIDFAGGLSTFRTLTSHDQAVLLKGATFFCIRPSKSHHILQRVFARCTYSVPYSTTTCTQNHFHQIRSPTVSTFLWIN